MTVVILLGMLMLEILVGLVFIIGWVQKLQNSMVIDVSYDGFHGQLRKSRSGKF